MFAFHVCWTKPNIIKNGKFEIEDFELLTTVLSALKWREKNGSIKMITDTAGQLYYKKLGLDILWDLGIEVVLDNVDVKSDVFWAGGKIFALKKQNVPCVMMDTDFIVWDKIDFDSITCDLAVIHREDIYENVYPDKDKFLMKETYEFPKWLDWSVKPCNTAFMYINDKKLLDEYTALSVEFMNNTAYVNDNLTYMVFAEQRLISMTAKHYNKDIHELSPMQSLGKQKMFTHTWGFKSQMRADNILRNDFCVKCVKRIKKDFPYIMDTLKDIDILKKYL